jgi:hypothetical protein
MDDFDGPPRPLYWIGVQLTVDSSADLAYTWIRSLAERVAQPQLTALAGLPARPVKSGPSGEAGVIEVSRSKDGGYPTTTSRTFSDKGSQWLRTELEDMPLSVEATISDTSALNGDLLVAKVRKPVHSPGWLLLEAELMETRFTDPGTAKAEQQLWLDALFTFADRVNPGYGHIAYLFDESRTALEYCTAAADLPRDEIEPDWTVGKSRQRLRGYSWVTILAQELADTLGGAAALSAANVFFEVRQLSAGGVWLRATEDFRDYDQSHAEAVFRTLAPVLRPVAPRENLADGEAPTFLVFEDPAAL